MAGVPRPRESRPDDDLSWLPGQAGDSGDRVARIVSAAEQTAETLRNDAVRAAATHVQEAEQRANERIAEAERAARLRVEAAEAEARDLLDDATASAERLLADERARIAQERELAHREAQKRADALRSEAIEQGEERLREAEHEAGRLETATRLATGEERVRADQAASEVTRLATEHAQAVLEHARAEASRRLQEADAAARELRDRADDNARAVGDAARATREEAVRLAAATEEEVQQRSNAQLRKAREVAHHVLKEGETLAQDLRELGRSLDVNAKILLDDVRATHAALTDALDRVTPNSGGRPGRSVRTERPDAGGVRRIESSGSLSGRRIESGTSSSGRHLESGARRPSEDNGPNRPLEPPEFLRQD